MRTIKQTLIILLVALLVGNIVSYFYLGLSDRSVPPVISCPEGVLDISTTDSSSVLLQDVTASDPQDGDLSGQVIIGGISKLISNNTAKVTYLVFDSDDNMASHVRFIRYVDYQRPMFRVEEPLVFSSTEEVMVMPLLKATDVVDGDISDRIRTSTLEPSSNTEIYFVSIRVNNSVGDTAKLRLPVLLLDSDPMRPTITLSTSLTYLKIGDSFDPEEYLMDLEVPGNPDVAPENVTISGQVDTSRADTYYIHYTYTNNGSIGTAILTVVVQ